MVMTTVAIIMLFGFAVLAVDVGVLALVKTQLQNAADAAVLAAVMPLALNNDTTAAINQAILFAGLNKALLSAGAGNGNVKSSVVITDADVTFPQARVVRVTTHRMSSTGDPIRTYFLPVVVKDSTLTSMTARASARFDWVCGGDCIKPWAPPDRWNDLDSNGQYDAGEPYDPVSTGYSDADLGTQITLVLGNGSQQDFGAFWYYSVDYPPINDGNPISGADHYKDWICLDCLDNTFLVDPGDSLRVEPGVMKGPNKAGLKCLIDKDPGAQWDATTKSVINSAYALSPRIIKAALFDPSRGLASYGGGKCVVVVKIMVIFIEGYKGDGDITGRFMKLADPGGAACEDQSNPTFLYKASLIE